MSKRGRDLGEAKPATGKRPGQKGAAPRRSAGGVRQAAVTKAADEGGQPGGNHSGGDAPTEFPAAIELGAADRLKQLGVGVVEWLKHDLRISLLFMVLGFLISWLANAVLVAVVYDGVGKVPPGSPAVGSANAITGSVFWALAMAILFGLLAYRMQVGGPKFWADLRGFPGSLGHMLRREGDSAFGSVLWGVAGSLVVSAALTPAVSAVFAAGTLVLLGGLLRTTLTGLLMLAWRAVVGAVAPKRRQPPADSTLSVVMLGAVFGFAVAYAITDPGFKLLGGIAAAVLAFVLSQRRGEPKVAMLLAVAGAAALVAFSRELAVLAADGGWRENGGDLNAWLNGGGLGVLGTSQVAGWSGAGGSLLGGGLGGQSQPTEQEMYDKYHQAYTKAHGGSDAGFDDWWRQSGFHQTTTMDNVRSTLGQYSWLANVPGLVVTNTPGALAQTGDALIKVFTGTIDSVKTAVGFYTSDSPEYRALRDMAAKEGIMPSVEDARQGFVNSVNTWADDMRTALANGDADKVQKMLAEFGGNMLGQAAMGAGGEAGMSMMAKSAQMQALSGLLTDAASAGNPLAKGLLTELNPGLTRGIQALNTDISKLGGTPPTMPAGGWSSVNSYADMGYKVPDGAVLDPAQQALVNQDLAAARALKGGESGINPIKVANAADGSAVIVKGEDAAAGGWAKTGIFGSQANNEVGAYVASRDLGLGVVPETAPLQTADGGLATAQKFESGEQLPASSYSALDQQKMAVLDYVTGNVDRHAGNWVSTSSGGPAAIDNGLSFPNMAAKDPSAIVGMKSDFVANVAGKTLDPELLSSIKAVDPETLGSSLRAQGIPEANVQQAMDRLREIQQNNMITGQTWATQSGGTGAIQGSGGGFKVFVKSDGTIVRQP